MNSVERERQASVNRQRFNEIVCGVWLGRVMAVAARLQIADAIGDEPETVDGLAARLGVDAASLQRVLRALAANGIFEEVDARTFRHSEMSRQLRRDHQYSLHSIAAFMGSQMHEDAWAGFSSALRDGRSGFAHHRGATLYEHFRDSPADAAFFNEAMVSYSLQPSATVAAALPLFRRARSLLDIGGGMGTFSAAVAKAHRRAQGVVLDLPHLAAPASDYLARAGVSERVRFQAGDFFAGVPGGHDVYVLKNILWNWDDERCIRILRNVRSAMGEAKEARLLVIEHIVLPSNQAWTTLFDLQMFAISASGRGRTEAEHRALAAEAGLFMESITQIDDTTIAELSPLGAGE